jgi:hypothetical protein
LTIRHCHNGSTSAGPFHDTNLAEDGAWLDVVQVTDFEFAVLVEPGAECLIKLIAKLVLETVDIIERYYAVLMPVPSRALVLMEVQRDEDCHAPVQQ